MRPVQFWNSDRLRTLVLAPHVGGTIDPADVVGRDDAVRAVTALVQSGAGVLVVDPRRMGKTSFLRRLCALSGPPMESVFVDFEGVDSADEFLMRLVRALADHGSLGNRMRDVLKGWFSGVDATVGPIHLGVTHTHRGAAAVLDDVMRDVDRALARDGKMLLIGLDEVPLAIGNIAGGEGGARQATLLLQTLRNARQAEHRSVRWVITGSIGFHHVLRRAGTTEGAINDLTTVQLGPLAQDHALALAAALLRGIDVLPDGPTCQQLADVSGRIPFLMHQLAHRLRGNTRPSPGDVVHVFDEFVRDRDQSRPMTHMLTRIDAYYGADKELAARLLNHVAKVSSPLTALAEMVSEDRERVGRVIDLLIDDHYLIELPDGTFRWRYTVLQTIWTRRQR